MSGEFSWDMRGGAETGSVMRFQPGEAIEGVVTYTPSTDLECRHAFIRLKWHTDGRGIRDTGVAGILDAYQGSVSEHSAIAFPFRFIAPESPWSYSGHFIRIIWEVELEVDVPMALNPTSKYAIIISPK